MAHIIHKLAGQNAEDIGHELRARELSLILTDIGTDETDNYGVYARRLVMPASSIVVLPEASVPPEDSDFIASGPLVIGGVKQVFHAYRVPVRGEAAAAED
ncbi:MAG: hypothetical protein OSA41_08490 [Erythrobacter sp.]|jgi:hypothetical protein|uniref:hypothetical protein n=1 Tax=Qipengyuania citrea TaxID=225971 RepID=UPI001A44E139|nr:hypothetical protein [Qipengyuania citrea]MBL4719136.1 hypothetical protein [Erythrobacter sp.]MCP2018334.1 hypothetical protein [Qipengyuania citrea]MDE0901741.1 hypothetical protein [Erythrobacter sp.]